jgi:signal transduction histidine kinase
MMDRAMPTLRRLLFLLSGLPLGIAWFTLLSTVWSLTLGLLITPLVIALFYANGAVTFGAGALEAALARSLLVAAAAPPRWPPRRPGWVGVLTGPLSSERFWRVQAYLALRASLGFALGTLTLALIVAGLALIAAPAYAAAVPEGLDYGVYTAHDFVQALAAVPVGCLVLAATVVLAKPMTRPFSDTSTSLLGDAHEDDGRAAPPADTRDPFVAPAGRGLAWHAFASAMLVVVVLLIWALAGAGYVWPVWVALPLAAALAIHWWVNLLARRPELWRDRGITHGLAIHAGVTAILCLYLIGIWAAAGGGSFWPAWGILGLGIPVALHAGANALGSGDTRALSERIDVLETTRAGAVDAEGERLRTIERDLHDGAQARLVALGMSLGMAEQKLADSEPAAAQELLAEARTGAEEALRELRDLARGIHPPVLTDRGLEAAVRSLADLSPLRVTVSVETGSERPPAAIESALYFVAAEALANAAKHAHAQHVDVRLRADGSRLRLDVVDDGVGGADVDGNGLSGLRRRVEALDGELRVTSPQGGPTIVHAELPCA